MSGYPDDDYGRDDADRDLNRYGRGPDDRDGRRDEEVVQRAKSMVAAPAVGLIVVAGLGLLSVVGGLVQYATLDAQFDEQIRMMEAQPNVPADQKKEQVRMMNQFREWAKVGWFPFYAVVGLQAVLTLIGGIKLLTLSSAGWGRASALLSMVPCTSGCCFLGLVFGFWALSAMGKPEVKAGFAAKRRLSQNPDSY